MTITDEMVLAAAQAGINRSAASETSSVSFSQRRYVYYAGFDLRAAIEAIVPAIRKAAMEEAEARICAALAAQRDRWDALMQGYRDAGMKEAASAANQRRAAFNHAVSIAAIRNLADKEGM